MFEQNRKSSLSSYVIVGALCAAAGYGFAQYRQQQTGVDITSNETGAYVSYHKSPPRKLQLHQGKVVVGTLAQRIDDLLDENPKEVRSITRSLVVDE